jgi:hypothetical protein
MLVKRCMTAMERVCVSLSEIFGPFVGAAGPMIFSFLPDPVLLSPGKQELAHSLSRRLELEL